MMKNHLKASQKSVLNKKSLTTVKLTKYPEAGVEPACVATIIGFGRAAEEVFK
jgi:hypothetical protein